MKTMLNDYLDALNIGRKQTCKNLAVYPLIANDKALSLIYLTLDQALQEDVIEIVETDEAGRVPELKLSNRSDQMILIIDGEELVGAKQNRIVNTTILIAAGASTVIPVSCVEQGRWSYETDRFYSRQRMMSPALRVRKTVDIQHSLKRSATFVSDQGALWDGITAKASRMQAESPTMAMGAIHEKVRPALQTYVNGFKYRSGQIGAIFAINGRIVGMECFDKPETFQTTFKKLLESYALDAIDRAEEKRAGRLDKKQACRYLKNAAGCRIESHPSVGLGTDHRLGSRELTGFALEMDGCVLHLAVFTKTDTTSERRSRSSLQRFTHRLNRRMD